MACVCFASSRRSPPDLGIESAVLEDCATLAWRAYSAGELWWLRLRQVTPGGDGAAL